jgi:hypothetical protein
MGLAGLIVVFASIAKQSRGLRETLDCFAYARKDGGAWFLPSRL